MCGLFLQSKSVDAVLRDFGMLEEKHLIREFLSNVWTGAGKMAWWQKYAAVS